MDILWLLVPLSVLLVFGIGMLLWSAVQGGQFEDLDRVAVDLLADDDSSLPGGSPVRMSGSTRSDPCQYRRRRVD